MQEKLAAAAQEFGKSSLAAAAACWNAGHWKSNSLRRRPAKVEVREVREVRRGAGSAERRGYALHNDDMLELPCSRDERAPFDDSSGSSLSEGYSKEVTLDEGLGAVLGTGLELKEPY